MSPLTEEILKGNLHLHYESHVLAGARYELQHMPNTEQTDLSL